MVLSLTSYMNDSYFCVKWINNALADLEFDDDVALASHARYPTRDDQ